MKRTLPFFLLMAACTSQSSDSQGGLSAAAAPPMIKEGHEGQDVVLIPADQPKGAPAYQPSRAPEFGFSPSGEVADSDLGSYFVEMECSVDGDSVGTMVFTFWPEKAPQTVRNFLRYCDEGFYDGLRFHRVLRDFMVQGGDPKGTGQGDGPHGQIPGEFSDSPEFSHEYGVLSMARGNSPDSASCQFFVCSDTGERGWNLDGSYASFGKLHSGVSTLEALANIPVVMGPGGEQSRPSQNAHIVKAVVRKGNLGEGTEVIARPLPELDLGGEAEKIVVQHVLISFAGTPTTATRTQEEAEALAQEVLTRAQQGEDFQALVVELSDDPPREGPEPPGVYRMLNQGVRDLDGERSRSLLGKEFMAYKTDLDAQMAARTLDQASYQAMMTAKRDALIARMGPIQVPREQMVPGFGDAAFPLKVGEVGIANYNSSTSPFGWHVIKRLE